MLAEPTPNAYVLSYSWPYKLIAPLCVLLGIAYPLLRRYVEWRQLDRGDWTMALLFVALGVVAGVFFGRSVSVSQDSIEFRSAVGRRHLRWDRVARLEARHDKFVLVSTSGERYGVAMQMANSDAFARELDARFDSSGFRRQA